MKIVLIGFMCTGKSRVGRILSEQLKWPLIDTDHLVEKTTGKTVADIILNEGEVIFREHERNAIASLGENDQVIISTGGGAPINEENRKYLAKNGLVIWLKASPETILSRMSHMEMRPLIDPKNPLESIKKRLSDRKEIYTWANHGIDTDGLNINEVAQKIIQLLPTNK